MLHRAATRTVCSRLVDRSRARGFSSSSAGGPTAAPVARDQQAAGGRTTALGDFERRRKAPSIPESNRLASKYVRFGTPTPVVEGSLTKQDSLPRSNSNRRFIVYGLVFFDISTAFTISLSVCANFYFYREISCVINLFNHIFFLFFATTTILFVIWKNSSLIVCYFFSSIFGFLFLVFVVIRLVLRGSRSCECLWLVLFVVLIFPFWFWSWRFFHAVLRWINNTTAWDKHRNTRFVIVTWRYLCFNELLSQEVCAQFNIYQLI